MNISPAGRLPARPVETYEFAVPTAAAMHDLGAGLAGVLRAGDLVLLCGPLGAGKTTLVQGIGRGLQVQGQVASPTFVLARVHQSVVDGPALVHVDAYRLGGLAELDDLDLDTDLDSAVTVVEWGTGVAEPLADSRLEVRIARSDTSEARRVDLHPCGVAWPIRRVAELASIEGPPRGVESSGARSSSS